MNGLEEQYGEEIDFIWLNVDDRSTLPMRQQYGMSRRSTYVLLDTNDQIVEVWIGFLNQGTLEFAIEEFLDSQS